MTNAATNLEKLELPTQLSILRDVCELTRAPVTITDHQDPEEPIIYCNQAFLDLTGYTAKEVIGKNCRFLQGKETDSGDVSELRYALKHNEPVSVNIKNYRKDGTSFVNELIMKPVAVDGVVTHFIGLQFDGGARDGRNQGSLIRWFTKS